MKRYYMIPSRVHLPPNIPVGAKLKTVNYEYPNSKIILSVDYYVVGVVGRQALIVTNVAGEPVELEIRIPSKRSAGPADIAVALATNWLGIGTELEGAKE